MIKTLRRRQMLFRLYPDQIEKLKLKAVSDSVTVQKIYEIMTKLYLTGNKHIMEKIEQFKSEKYVRKRRYSYNLTEMEADELLRKIEEVSPVAELDGILKKLEEEDEDADSEKETKGLHS